MSNPFSNNSRDMRFEWFGLVSDWIEVTPNDATALLTGASGQLGVAPAGSPSEGTNSVGLAFYCETGGTIVVHTPWGSDRTIVVPDKQVFQMAVRGIKSTGTTATDIHVAVVY